MADGRRARHENGSAAIQKNRTDASSRRGVDNVDALLDGLH
jgi:hypothetical protein